MRPVGRLWVAYDATCGLCTGVKDWLGRQAALVPLEFVMAGSEEARRRFPQVPAGELAVISDTGEVWLGNGAWIVCLWALRDFRTWSVRLSGPALKLLAREAFSVLSANRAGLSSMLGMASDLEIEQRLRKVMIPRCESESQPTQSPPGPRD
jgi:predicted DCC family thiol-disulfide oxidoreductase YuxK